MMENEAGQGAVRFGRREFLLMTAAVLAGCDRSGAPASAPAATGVITVVATVGMVADLAKRIGGDAVAVETLMGPGVDPHLYKVTADDLVRLQRAELVLYSGLHLEGKMQDVLALLGGTVKRAHAVTDTVPREKLLRPEGFEGQFDPHVWFDVESWSFCARSIVTILSNLRPSEKAAFEQRGAAVQKSLRELHEWVKTKVAEIPEARRILVTSHDAFNYFGRTYGFRVIALQGISTVTEAGLADMAKLVDYIRDQRVRSIFVESSVPHTTIERISRDAGVTVGGELFSDAMGVLGRRERDYDLGTYDGMIRHNVHTIIEALR